MHHNHRHMAVAIFRDLILHVHLVDRDLAAAESTAASGRRISRRRWRSRQRFGFPADKETSLFLQNERLRLPLPRGACGEYDRQYYRQYPATSFHHQIIVETSHANLQAAMRGLSLQWCTMLTLPERTLTRRQALQTIAAGAAAAALPRSLSAQGPASQGPTFPKGAIIRAILRDYQPEELAMGATLFHEHLQLSPDFSREIRRGYRRRACRQRSAAGPGARRQRRRSARPGHHAQRRSDERTRSPKRKKPASPALSMPDTPTWGAISTSFARSR